MTADKFLNQVVMRRDGEVALVTAVSGGWLLLDGGVDNSALPAEVQVVDLNEPDYRITKSAQAFGIDPLQAGRIPDLARKKVAQNNHAYSALQVVAHPSVEKAYLTIKGIDDSGCYEVSVKPSKGASYTLVLNEASIRKFENEGILPMTDKPQEETVTPVVESSAKQATIDSLRAENSSLHTQLEVANKLLRSQDVADQDADDALVDANKTLAKTLDDLADLQEKFDALSKKHEVLTEQAAKENLELMRLRKEATKPASAPVPPVPAVEESKFSCKIIKNTSEKDFERLWSDGWMVYHTEFNPIGDVRSVWKKVNDVDDSPEPLVEKVVVANEPFADIFDVDGALYATNPIEIDMATVPAVVTPPENTLQLGKYGTALMTHGLEATKDAMNAEVALAALKAAEDIEIPTITHFLPAGEVTS